MDPERTIRFLYPPLFLIASLLWGLWLDTAKSLGDIIPLALSKQLGTSILTIIAGGGVLVIASGLLIGSISLFLLRGIALICKWESHEAILSTDALNNIQRTLRYDGTRTRRDDLFLAATFDHDLLAKPIHTWLLRRWNAFNINISSFNALWLSLLIGWRLELNVGCEWLLTSLTVGLVFVAMAIWAWRDTMGMIEFQARRMADELNRKDLGRATDP